MTTSLQRVAGSQAVTGGKWQAIIMNGPQFIAQIEAVEVKVMRLMARSAIKDAAEIVKQEWIMRIPVNTRAGDKDAGAYMRSLRIRTRSYTKPGDATGDPSIVPDRKFKGVAARIYPGPVAGVDEDEQPMRYAGVLEYGGRLTAKQHSSFIPAQPSARPAADAAFPRVLGEFASALRSAIP